MKGGLSIRVLLLVLVLAVVVPLAALLVYTLEAATKEDVDEALEASVSQAELAAANVRQFLLDSQDLLGHMVEQPSVQNARPGDCEAIFTNIPHVLPQFASLVLADASGRIICAAGRPSDASLPSVADRQWFEDAVRNAHFTIGAAVTDRITGRWVSVLAMPVHRGHGEVTGVLGLRVDLVGYEVALKNLAMPYGALITIADGDGMVIGRSAAADRWVGLSVRDSELADLLAAGGPGHSRRMRGADGVERFYGLAPLPEAGWSVYAGIPVKSALARTYAILWRNGLLGLLVLLGVGVLAISIGHRIQKPIKALASAAQAAAEGSHEVVVPVEGPAEIAEVAARFNAMVQARTRAEAELIESNARTRWSLRELERRNRELNLLSRMGDMLQACKEPTEAYEVLREFAPQLFPETRGMLAVVSESRNLVESVAEWGELPGEVPEPVFGPHDCWALRGGRVYRIPDVRVGLTCPHVGTAEAGGASLCVPMTPQGEGLGLLHLRIPPAAMEEGGDRDLEATQVLATGVAEHFGMALANLRMRETLRIQSTRDPLTGLYNRRYMEDSLEREIRRCMRKGAPMGVIMIDIDHFKRFNDAFGHEAGDAMLRSLSHLLRNQVRADDIACRYGGEEFIIVLPESTLEVTRQRAERVRESAKHLQVALRDQPLGPITLSLGVAVLPAHGSTADELIRTADTALYEAKAAGRDRVAAAGAPD